LKIVVTGVSGHVGGAIAARLTEQGHEIIGISRTQPKGTGNNNFKYIQADITSADFLSKVLAVTKTADATVHAAACLDNNLSNIDVSSVNCFGTQQALLLSQRLNTEAFLYISSLSFLGIPSIHPITETHPVTPQDLYAASKLYGEQLVSFAQSTTFSTISLRVSSPVGPGLKYKRIFRLFIEKALKNEVLELNGKGTRCQDYVDVRDIGQAVEKSLLQKAKGIYNIASGVPISNLHLAQRCIEVLNSKSEIQFSGKPDAQDEVSWDLSIQKAQEAFDYKPQIPIETSIVSLANEILNGC